MPDVTMCCNFKCPLKDKCYRYRAIPDAYWQSFAFYKYKDGTCDYYWEINIQADKVLPTAVVDNRFERDSKWAGLEEKDE